ncbi:MAG: radical SAM protein [Myxococcales bacterium]|nr:radical SAM protein [Myxococcales bacterium]
MLWQVIDRLETLAPLEVTDHSRSVAGMVHVYPVVSRRAGGVSVGINLNPNNACNWRCVYCQVPGLILGKGPRIDLELLERELGEMLDAIVHGDFMQRSVPEGARRLNDVAFSGNGEPTTSPDFPAALDVVVRTLEARNIAPPLRLILITNGSMLGKPPVLDAVRSMAKHHGEIWFKLDSATAEGSLRVNNCHASPEDHAEKLRTAALACPTWLQTCWFSWHGATPDAREEHAYLKLLRELRRDGVPLAGVHLYTLARASHQPEAPQLDKVSPEVLEQLARRIRALGLTVKVSA